MAANRSNKVRIVLLVVLGILVLAWIDGGEERLHTITQPVEVPEGAL